jgi:hypothetical protein
MSGLTPKVTSTRAENNPLSRAAEWLGRISLYPRLVSCNTRAERVEMVWRWCGDSPPLDLAVPSRWPGQWDHPGPRKSLAWSS